MGYEADTQVGRVTALEKDTIFRPRTPRAGTCGVILFHGQSNPDGFTDSDNQKAACDLAAALANAGIPAIAAEFGGNSWANDPSMTAGTNAWTALKAEYPSMRTDKVCVLGISMGAALAARYTQLNPSDVAAMVGIIPAYDPKACYIANNVGDAYMEAAWSFSGLGNFPAGLDLAASASSMAGVPLLTGYASNDSIVPAASVTAYHSAAGGTAGNLVNLGALDHTDAAIGAMSISTVVRFLAANGA